VREVARARRPRLVRQVIRERLTYRRFFAFDEDDPPYMVWSADEPGVHDSAPQCPSVRRRRPYVLAQDAVESPPANLWMALTRIGPGLVLAASIVGSGELIATTTLGAQVGFTLLWIILVSCVIKPIVQGELGRYTIATGHTGLEGFNQIPGPRVGVNWLVWAWALTVTLNLLLVGGMYGAVAQVLTLLVPAVPVNVWVGVCCLLTLTLLLGAGYERIERLAFIKVGVFTILTMCAAAILLRRPGAVSMGDLAAGFSTTLPAASLGTAIAVFGITGVGASELAMYPYWCVEKGYARFVGPNDGSRTWVARARGWSRVMHLDIVCSLAIYTLATVAFYLLGAGVLHPDGPGSRRPRHHRRAGEHLHADTRHLVAVGVLRGRSRNPLRNHLRNNSCALQNLCRCGSHPRCLRARRHGQPTTLADPLRGRALHPSRHVVLVVCGAGTNGGGGRHRASDDAPAHWRCRHLLIALAAPARDSSRPRDHHPALGLDGGDVSLRGVLHLVTN